MLNLQNSWKLVTLWRIYGQEEFSGSFFTDKASGPIFVPLCQEFSNDFSRLFGQLITWKANYQTEFRRQIMKYDLFQEDKSCPNWSEEQLVNWPYWATVSGELFGLSFGDFTTYVWYFWISFLLLLTRLHQKFVSWKVFFRTVSSKRCFWL